jgi:hypothetical protein
MLNDTKNSGKVFIEILTGRLDSRQFVVVGRAPMTASQAIRTRPARQAVRGVSEIELRLVQAGKAPRALEDHKKGLLYDLRIRGRWQLRTGVPQEVEKRRTPVIRRGKRTVDKSN